MLDAADRLPEMLARLKLTCMRDQLDSLLDEAARADLDLRQALALLCEREIARKDQRRIEMALKLAHFPFVRELAGFDFAAQPSLDPKQVRDLGQCRWIANGENVLFLGPPGVGKTHLAIEPCCKPEGGLGLPALPDDERERAVRELAEIFDVNPVVVRIRLDELFPAHRHGQLTL